MRGSQLFGFSPFLNTLDFSVIKLMSGETFWLRRMVPSLYLNCLYFTMFNDPDVQQSRPTSCHMTRRTVLAWPSSHIWWQRWDCSISFPVRQSKRGWTDLLTSWKSWTILKRMQASNSNKALCYLNKRPILCFGVKESKKQVQIKEKPWNLYE